MLERSKILYMGSKPFKQVYPKIGQTLLSLKIAIEKNQWKWEEIHAKAFNGLISNKK